MEQLRLVAVHDDGEHLIVETPDSTRYRLKIDQQLRQTIQHARRKPPARGRGGSSYGPRDIQARFRAGASVDDVVAESGWEAERVRRYEWPILAERSHMVAEACRVTVSGTNPSRDGYRSVFEGEPASLEDTVAQRATQLGVDRSSFDWDAWLREDQLWTVQLSFSVTDGDASGLPTAGPARWSYNPVTRSVRPENDWARTLGEEPRETGPLGTAAPTAPAVAPNPQLRQLQHEASQADELLDVLQSRRGHRLGADEDGDDRLAEILGRGMGRVDQRPRPIDAPEDSPVFDRPIQPAASRVAEEKALREDGIEIVDDSTPLDAGDSGDQNSREETERAGPPAGDNHAHAAEDWVDVTEVPVEDGGDARDRPQDVRPSPVTPLHGRAPEASASDSGTTDPEAQNPTSGGNKGKAPDTGTSGSENVPGSSGADDSGSPAETGSADGAVRNGDREASDPAEAGDRSHGGDRDEDTGPQAPGPRGRTPRAKRSSVPSWDDIVFGANRS